MSWTYTKLFWQRVESQHDVVVKSVNMLCLWHPIFLSFSSAEGPDPCELAQNPRYRKGPDVCFDNNENVRDKHSHAFVERISRETA